MPACRFRDTPGHLCVRRDGREIRAGDDTPCFYEARAQVLDETRLALEVDASMPRLAVLGNHPWAGIA